MVCLIWTDNALEDMNEIYSFISRDSNFYAKNVVQKIRERVLSIKLFPNRGRLIPEINDTNYREIFQWRYRIMYKIAGDNIYILSIIHGARDFKRTL